MYIKQLMLLLLFTTVAYGEESTLFTHSLDSLLQFAGRYNPSIAAARSAVEASRHNTKKAAALPDPVLMGRAEIDEGISPTAVGISQTIPNPYTLTYRKHAAEELSSAAEEALREKIAHTVYDVRSAYSKLYQIGQSLRIKQATIDLLKQYEHLLTTSYTTGTATSSHLLRVAIEMERIAEQMQHDSLEGESVLLDLLECCGIPLSGATFFPDSLPLYLTKYKVDTLLPFITAHSPALSILRSEHRAQKAATSEARSRYVPDLTVGIDYMKKEGQMSGSTWMFSPSIGINIPVWYSGKKAQYRKSRALEAVLESSIADRANKLRTKVATMINQFEDERRSIHRLETVLIPQTRQMLLLMENEYRTGSTLAIDILDGQRMLLDLEIELISRRTSQAVLMTGLLQLAGDTGGVQLHE